MWQVYIFCYPDDHYFSCVLFAYCLVFNRIFRVKVIRYLYYELSIFFTSQIQSVFRKEKTSVYFYLEKNIRNYFVWYCNTPLHKMFLLIIIK